MKLWTGLIVAMLAFVFAGQANAGVLYDQQDPTSPESTNSQDFETMFDTFDAMVADDFTVPAGRTWRLESVLFRGTAVSPATIPSGMRVTLFSDSAGSPGAELSTRIGLIQSGTYPKPLTTLPDSPVLTAGTYWLGAQAILNAGTFSGPQWFWADSDAGPFGNAAYYRNPGDGFDGGCPTFEVRSTCEFPDSFHPSHDQSFSMNGTDFSAVPNTTISSGPAEGSTITTNSASFGFSSVEPGATFACRRDGAPFAACTSPASMTGLDNGNHSFAVAVTNGLGETDPTPATRAFNVNVATTPAGPSAACKAAKASVTKAKAKLKKAKAKKAKSKAAKKARAKAIKKAKAALKTANGKVSKNC